MGSGEGFVYKQAAYLKIYIYIGYILNQSSRAKGIRKVVEIKDVEPDW